MVSGCNSNVGKGMKSIYNFNIVYFIFFRSFSILRSLKKKTIFENAESLTGRRSMENQRVCPVCGEKIVGRSDKKFCSDECRVYHHNRKNREKARVLTDNRYFNLLYSNVFELCEHKSELSLKILVFISKICKIVVILAHKNR